jgi:membrane protease subunit (stomatin/prohibitin family)
MKIADIIKYEGDNSTFIWKHPCEDFNSMTQLIVHESQEAIFFMNGQALDMFGAGRHTLETQNIPKIGKFLNRATGGDTPFHCEVYFINKTVQMAVKWGTDSKVRFLDPNLGIPLEIGACGEMNLAVSDSRKLLLKLVGTMNGIAWGDSGVGFTKSIQNCFRPLISTAVKTHLSNAIKSNNIDILEIDERLEQLSEIMRQSILGGFEEYGLTIPQFYITNIAFPENDPNFRRMKELHTISLQTRMAQADAIVRSAQADADAQVIAARRRAVLEEETTATEIARREAERDLIRAQAEAQAAKIAGFAEAEVMAAKGYTQKDVLAADVQKAYAEGIGNMTINGGGGVAGDMIGLGVGMAAAGAVAPQLGEMFKGFGTSTAPTTPAQSESDAKCVKCGATLPQNAKFCLECGEKVLPPVPSSMIVCPECGNTIAKGKFCPECGHKFITACPKCGAEVTSGAKFCLECGEKLR